MPSNSKQQSRWIKSTAWMPVKVSIRLMKCIVKLTKLFFNDRPIDISYKF